MATTSAAYLQDNDAAGNALIALQISECNGTLLDPVKTSTGGKGLAGLIAVSQDLVVVDGDYIFTVNAGDNTFSLFTINGHDPTQSKLAGKTLPTLSQTPVLAYSNKLKSAYALNPGPQLELPALTSHPMVPLTKRVYTNTNHPQTEQKEIFSTYLLFLPTQLQVPLVLGSDLSFNPTSTALFATLRSNDVLPDLLYTYHLSPSGQVSVNPIFTPRPSLPLVLCLNFLDNSPSRLFVLNPHQSSSGTRFLNMESSSIIAIMEKVITIPGQITSWWAAYAPQFDAIIGPARPNITTISPATGNMRGQASFSVDEAVGIGWSDSKS